MMTANDKDVVAHKDDTFMILHAKDRFNGINVQLYTFIEQRKQDHEGKITSNGIKPVLLEERIVSFYKYKNGRPAPTNATQEERGALYTAQEFRDAVIGAEAYLKARMASVYLKMESMADGVLNDLRSKYRALNGESTGTTAP